MTKSENKIKALLENSATFSDKGRQMAPESIVAFGISLTTRYGKVYEMIDMLTFAQQAANSAVAHYVKGLEYDSKACACSFELDDSVVEGSEVERELFRIARASIPHFHWFDEEYFEGMDE